MTAIRQATVGRAENARSLAGTGKNPDENTAPGTHTKPGRITS